MLLKLTGIPHPDLNDGKSQAVYLDASRILVIESTTTKFLKRASTEAWRQAVNGLYDEVLRVAGEASNPPSMVVDSPEAERAINRYMRAKEAAAALSAAYGLVSKSAVEGAWHEEVACTCVSLACGTGLEHGVMLCRVNVTERPEEVAAAIAQANKQTSDANAARWGAPWWWSKS